MTATTHSCDKVTDPYNMPGLDADSQELFQQKQYFMYSVFNKVLQSDMGKTIVRKHVPTLDAQSVWKEFETHMSTSSKGLNERCRLHAYVSPTVYDRSWKGTTEQCVLHFHEQFRQLDELTPLDEQLPHSVSKPWYNGPVYPPKQIYALLNKEAQNELDKYNKEKKAN